MKAYYEAESAKLIEENCTKKCQNMENKKCIGTTRRDRTKISGTVEQLYKDPYSSKIALKNNAQ